MVSKQAALETKADHDSLGLGVPYFNTFFLKEPL